MGKASRNRARRADEAARLASSQRTRQAVAELLGVTSFDEYVALLERRPELGTDEAADQLRDASGRPSFGPVYARAALLLDGAGTGDATAAWAAYREATDQAQLFADAAQPLVEELHAAKAAGDHPRVLELVELLLPTAATTGLGTGVCDLLNERGLALFNLGTIDRADELDGAIDAFQAAF